ncbi:MAG: hypothetical protein U9R00_00020 [Patescibacteria group bacterium]|nr:hypothetical protein [Patescibacteria group bacterium]
MRKESRLEIILLSVIMAFTLNSCNNGDINKTLMKGHYKNEMQKIETFQYYSSESYGGYVVIPENSISLSNFDLPNIIPINAYTKDDKVARFVFKPEYHEIGSLPYKMELDTVRLALETTTKD